MDLELLVSEYLDLNPLITTGLKVLRTWHVAL
jgi:hypothetical protein